MHLLLIEPDLLLAKIYMAALKRAGHTVKHAVSAQQAVHLADKHAPDAVIVELQLPRHNGVEFLYEFRSYSEWLQVPIVVHTAVPLSELAGAATLHAELGVQRVLYKPATSLEQLCTVIQQVAAAAAPAAVS
ncbi:MAG TPA: response regulator [Candidatus Saccharimonadales bacterium]|nr:response regulator [Candidatus Saccharimonadales bacterium]